MLAREKWQIKTIAILERVFEERCRQMAKHGEAMRHLPDGTGPDVQWLDDIVDTDDVTASDIQKAFRGGYEGMRATPGGEYGQLTRMHLVREEIAEAFELAGDDPRFVDEILQVAALCVQWAEYKIEEHPRYRGYTLRINGGVEIWSGSEFIHQTTSRPRAESIIDAWLDAP